MPAPNRCLSRARAGKYDVYLIKTDSDGNMIWNRTFGGSKDDSGWSVQVNRKGEYIIAGYTSSYGETGQDIYLIKLRSHTLGNLTFSHTAPINKERLYDPTILLQAAVTFDGAPVQGATVRFYLDSEYQGLNISNKNGYASFSYQASEGNHTWSTIAEKNNYTMAVSPNYNFHYKQPQLIVNSQYGSVTGEGVYKVGDIASFSVSPHTIVEGPEMRRIFVEWTSPEGYSGSDNPASVNVRKDIVETAQCARALP